MDKEKPALRSPALDGLRGAAALGVVAVHCVELGFSPAAVPFAGVLGVTVFFTLSGFLMALLHADQDFNEKMVWSYAVSRVARIAPLYLFAVLAAWVIHAYDANFIYDIDRRNIVRHLLFSGSERIFWTIPPEVQFYVFFIAIWFSVAKAKSGRYLPALLTAIAIAAMSVASPFLPGTTLPTKLPFFLLGAGAGLLGRRLRDMKGSSLLQGALLAAVLIVAAYVFGLTGDEETVYHCFPYAVLCVAMILAFYLPARLGDTLFGNPVMRKVGVWSFAIYILHEPGLYWGRKIQMGLSLPGWCAVILGLVLGTILSVTAHYMIERPSQRFLKAAGKHLFEVYRSRRPLAVEPVSPS